MPEIIMIIGPSGVGKTRWAEYWVAQGYVRLNRDTEQGKILSLVHKMNACIRDGKSVVLDNTFLTAEKRQPFIEAAHELGAIVKCYIRETNQGDAQFNLCKRIIEAGVDITDLNAIKVHPSPNVFPSSVHFRHWKEFQKPTEEEGFDEIILMGFKRSPSPYNNKALILDYDGTLRRSLGPENYPLKPSDVILLPKRKEVLQKYEEEGYFLLGASNQSAVGKGQLSYNDACDCFDKTNELLGLDIDYLFCPHKSGPINCWCRKPMPGIAVQFIEKYKLDMEQTIMVGDQTSDVNFAQRAGIQFRSAEEFFQN